MPHTRPLHLPNLFILGAAKSGTTTLHKVLSGHPDVFMSAEKEPTFFCSPFQVVSSPVDYFKLFDSVQDERWIGEASHGYLSDPESPRLLNAFFPEARFILILRNPADRAFSLYNHMRRTGLERSPTFEIALQRESARIGLAELRTENPRNLNYFESGLYGEQIARYLTFFRRDQFLFLSFDDWMQTPNAALEEICSFLQIPLFTVSELPKENRGYRNRIQLLDDLMRWKPIARMVRSNQGLYKALLYLNRSSPPPIHPDTRAKLMERYAADLADLFQLTNLDLRTPKGEH
jgi:hypothetical protein